MGRRDPREIRRQNRKKWVASQQQHRGPPINDDPVTVKILRNAGRRVVQETLVQKSFDHLKCGNYSPRLPILVDGNFYYDGSFGVVARNTAMALEKAGADVICRGWKEGNHERPLHPSISKNIGKPFDTRNFVYLRISHPDSFNICSGKYNIGLGVTEERVVTDKKWVDYSNHCCHQVWVPSEFVKKSFEAAGIKNVVVVHHPIHGQRFSPMATPYDYKTDDFKFLFVGVAQHRKGIDILNDAFHEEFDGEKAKLFIKTFDWGHAEIYESDNVKVIHDDFTDDEMPSLYTGADCFVLPSRSEGFGLPALEAMACGCPVIATNYSGLLEFCNDDNSWLIDVESYQEPIFGQGKPFGAKPSKNHLKELMRKVFDGGDEILRKIKNGIRTAQKFNMTNIGKEMMFQTRLFRKPLPPTYNGWTVKFQERGDITYYDGWCGDSFSMVGIQHRRALKKNFSVYELPISGINSDKNEVGNSRVGVLHPLMYNYELIGKFKAFYEVAGGFDVADSNHITQLGMSVINKADFVIVPTEGCRRTYISSGCNIPVHVCNHNLRENFYRQRETLKYVDPNKINVFHFCIHSDARKGKDVFEHLAKTFKHRQNVQFWIRGSHSQYAKQLPWFDKTDLVRCYDSMGVLVCPSRGGGFELNVLEAMARGVIPLTSDWHNVTEYSKDYAIQIESKRRMSQRPLNGNPIHDGWGADPDYDDAVRKMRYILDNYDYLKKKAESNMMKAREDFSPNKIALTLKKIFGEYV